MYSWSDPFFWLTLLGICASFFLAFYIPGRVVIGKLKLADKNVLPVLSFITGIVLWAWQGYLLGLLHLRVLTYVYLAVFAGIFIYKKYYQDIRLDFHFFKKIDWVVLLIAVIGIAGQMFPYLDMGRQTPEGVRMMWVNMVDHVWHAGITLDLVNHMPPNEPGMSGILLKDYHYWFNLATADLLRVFHLPLLPTQFLGMYPLICILLVFIGYYFAKLLYDNKLFIRLFLFFIFFCGDITIWIVLFLQHQLVLILPSLIVNGTKFIDSPGFGYSIVVGFAALYFLFQEKEKLPKKTIILTALLFSSLFEFKVYTGITFMAGLGLVACYSLFKKRFDRVLVFILAACLGAFIVIPNFSPSGGLFFLPFEVPRDFITQKILGFYDWELRWRIYQDHHNYLRIIQYGMYMSVFYLAAQFGPLLIGIIPWKKTWKIVSTEQMMFYYGTIVSGILLGLLFYQKVGGANIWEFLLPVIFILSLLSALLITKLIQNQKYIVRLVVITLIVIFVMPRWLDTVTREFKLEYLSGFFGISNEEYASYVYLSNHSTKDDIVMIVNHPKPVILSSYVKVLSGAQLYLSGEGTRQIVTPEIQKRRDTVALVQSGYNRGDFSLLTGEHIKYLYYYGTAPGNIASINGAHIVFQNKSATIIQIN